MAGVAQRAAPRGVHRGCRGGRSSTSRARPHGGRALGASSSDIRERCEGHLPRNDAVLGTVVRRCLRWPRAEHSADGGTEPPRDTGQSREAALGQRVTPRDFTTCGLGEPGRVDKARASHPGRHPRGRRAGLRQETPRSPARNDRRRRMPTGRACRRPRRLLPLRLPRRGVRSLPQPATRKGLVYNKGDIGDRRWEECWHFENEGEQHSSTCRYRHAGFVNSSAYANYRAVGDALYIGVLGNTADVTDVWDWVRLSRGEETPPGEMGEVPYWPTLYEGELVSVAP
jgi:hypothetical protein